MQLTPHRPLLLATLALGLSLPGAAQSVSISPNALTNKDIVTLASAGFSESFILDLIAGSRTQFDTTSGALADLAKHAINEQIIRVMLEQSKDPGAAGGASQPGSIMPVVMAAPGPKPKNTVVRPSAVSTAISAGAPYYESRSVLWGLWKRTVGVAAPPPASQATAPHLGPWYQQVRLPAPYLRPVPAGFTYYSVAP